MKLKGIVKTREVWLNGEKLSPKASQGLINHSPDGFNWGYLGSGPAQLALAILLEETDHVIAKKFYQMLKVDLIAKIPMDMDFDIAFDLDAWLIKTGKAAFFRGENE